MLDAGNTCTARRARSRASRLLRGMTVHAIGWFATSAKLVEPTSAWAMCTDFNCRRSVRCR